MEKQDKLFLVSLTVILVSAFWIGIYYVKDDVPFSLFSLIGRSQQVVANNANNLSSNQSGGGGCDLSNRSSASGNSSGNQSGSSLSIDTGLKFSGFPQTLVSNGVIDMAKYEQISPLSSDQKEIFSSDPKSAIVVTDQNSQTLLNLFWGLGLAQKNIYLENSELGQLKKSGQLERLASTGGWIVSKTSATDYFSSQNILNLTDEQQKMVADMAAGIYRPCCNNHARFSDCNHGMAILGVLSLGASQGMSASQLYKLALEFNYSWFSSQYDQIFNYMQLVEKKNPGDVSAQEFLSKQYSSASGFNNVQKALAALNGGASQQRSGGGGGCSL